MFPNIRLLPKSSLVTELMSQVIAGELHVAINIVTAPSDVVNITANRFARIPLYDGKLTVGLNTMVSWLVSARFGFGITGNLAEEDRQFSVLRAPQEAHLRRQERLEGCQTTSTWKSSAGSRKPTTSR